jgi:hypothetical protein
MSLRCFRLSAARKPAVVGRVDQIITWVPQTSRFCSSGHELYCARSLAEKFSIDRNDRFFARGVGAETAPAPLLRQCYQSALHRVAMHVAKLLHLLFATPDIEVIETGLPEGIRHRNAGNNSVCRERLRRRAAESTRRATPCLSAFSTTERFRRSGSLSKRWTCSGITT